MIPIINPMFRASIAALRVGGASRFQSARPTDRLLAALLVVILAFSPNLAMAQIQTATIALSPPTQRRLGIATQKLVDARQSAEIDAFAKVLDPAPLVQSENDLETAQAAAAASRAEVIRAQALQHNGGSISAKASEAAVAQARSDALRIVLVRRQIAIQWGPGVAKLSDGRLRRLVAGLVKGSIALIHVDTHNNEGQAGAHHVKIDVGADSVEGRVIGPARQAEPRLQSSGLIAEVSGHAAMSLAVGLTQSAHIEQATSQSGVVIPRGAVIRFQGADWAFVRTAGGFQRRLMQNPAVEANGIFVASGFSPGTEVVTAGAAQLFADELSLNSRGD